MHWLTDPGIWMALATLTALEIVLGVDNIIFISILAGKLPRPRQGSARAVGLFAAMLTRIGLLLSLSWMVGLTRPFFSIFDHPVSGRDLILLLGGMFLLGKSTWEIHENLEGPEIPRMTAKATSFWNVIVQIMLLDIVFSLDSVITAVGMVRQIPVMIAAIVLSIIVMLFASRPIAEFVDRHPTVKMLALSFLLLIGFSLIADGLGHHVPKGYIYFAMGFSVFVEMINLRIRARTEPVRLTRMYGEKASGTEQA